MAADWSRIKEILGEALALDQAERRAYLDGAGLSAEDLAEVESLVELEADSEGMFGASAVELARDFVGAATSAAGTMVGPYKIVSELGHGGMGAVYLAERADGKFDQKAAVKLLKRELNTAALRRHFDREREILASLEHPNIARLLDAGTTDDGIPFIAMEYVDGSPIDEYCVRHGLDLTARLRLFMTVCTTVDFAHRNLVVHRDLKPSNIMVTHDGAPKLLDFGISKILTDGYQGSDAATITQMGVMTPSYASPEQLRRESVTTLSDVYSLGVILFELLSGRRPFEAEEGDLRAIYSAVLEREPSAPSSLANMSKRLAGFERPDYRSGEAVTEKLGTDFSRVRNTGQHIFQLSPQTLKGDLDNIVLKALRKEPERRYASAGAVAEDLERHLNGLPVTARPNTLSYRASKFIGRHKFGVGAGVLIVLAIVAGIVATLWQMQVVRTERARAEKRFNDVRTLANSFLFEFSPLIERLPGSTPARELLVKRALEYLDGLAAESADDPTLLRELASAYEKVGDVQGNPYQSNVGDVSGAMASYEKSRQIREALLESGHGDAKLEGELAGIYKSIGDVESNSGDYAKSMDWHMRSLAMRERLAAAAPNDRDARKALAMALRTIGITWFYDNNNKKAIEYYEQSRDMFKKLAAEFPADDKLASEYAYSFVTIGEAQGWEGELEAAAANLQKGLDMTVPIAERHPNDQEFQHDLTLTLNKRAENLEDLEKPDEAAALYEKSLSIARKNFDADPQSQRAKRDVAMGAKKLAQALTSAKRDRDALEKIELALKLFAEIRDADKSNKGAIYEVANARFSKGELYFSLKDWKMAVKTFEEAKAEFDASLAVNPGDSYTRRMSSLNLYRIGMCYSELPRSAENVKRAAANLSAALESLNKMKAEGVLGDIDVPLLEEIPTLIAKLGS
ncbi:MAG TPA: serine/threonine-protein kinase [Pyrinomonadaceae bacterium]|nr:serine/threonine-protein kinase [Pyrinomonadaceae bacterium]